VGAKTFIETLKDRFHQFFHLLIVCNQLIKLKWLMSSLKNENHLEHLTLILLWNNYWWPPW